MSDKQWIMVFTKGGPGLVYRYAIEYPIQQKEINSEQDYNEWFEGVATYFKERTGIKEVVLGVEGAEFINAYRYRDVKEK